MPLYTLPFWSDPIAMLIALAVALAALALVLGALQPREWRRVFAAAAVAIVITLIFLQVACSPTQPDPPPPPTTVITCTNTGSGNVCGVGNGAPTPSPSPSGSPAATIACSDVHPFTSSFGWNGPATATRPANQLQPYTLCTSCASLLTTTLKGPEGDLPLTIASGKGRPTWTVSPLGVVDIDSSVEATRALGGVAALNNPDGYNLAVKPSGPVGSTATVHVVINANCVGEPPAGDFKYVVTQ